MSLATNNAPVSLPSLSKLTGSFSPFPTRLTDDIQRNESFPGLQELHYNGYQKSLNTIQNYPSQSDKSIPEHTDPANRHSRYERSLSPSDIPRRASDPTNTSLQKDENHSDRILSEKRKRNANASARFRDRRKQRERELQEKYRVLEEKTKQFESALKQIDPNHPLIAQNTTTPQANDTLFQRVDQLESLMQHFHHEKETSTQRLKELEDENKYLKSLIAPIGHHA
ncbi:hypothetical protein K501DRAFT_216218 [Backusella circina FSU 941]|nr:hypothetical protein K501DRAFT_216218 [Backusella circina FSU 941]